MTDVPTPDVTTVQITGRVGTLDEAFAWVVRHVDAHGFDRPNISISPVFQYPPYGPEGPTTEGEWMFEVSVGSEVCPTEATL